MTKQELYELLEIDTPADVEYYEQLAELLEHEGDIPQALFFDVLSAIEAEQAGEFAENYFAELTGAIPDNAGAELLTEALTAMEQRLMLLAQDMDDEQAREDFAREMHKFRLWLHEEGGAAVDGVACTLLDAFTEMRAERLGIGSHRYSLEDIPDLTPEELTFRIGRFEAIDL